MSCRNCEGVTLNWAFADWNIDLLNWLCADYRLHFWKFSIATCKNLTQNATGRERSPRRPDLVFAIANLKDAGTILENFIAKVFPCVNFERDETAIVELAVAAVCASAHLEIWNDIDTPTKTEDERSERWSGFCTFWLSGFPNLFKYLTQTRKIFKFGSTLPTLKKDNNVEGSVATKIFHDTFFEGRYPSWNSKCRFFQAAGAKISCFILDSWVCACINDNAPVPFLICFFLWTLFSTRVNSHAPFTMNLSAGRHLITCFARQTTYVMFSNWQVQTSSLFFARPAY